MYTHTNTHTGMHTYDYQLNYIQTMRISFGDRHEEIKWKKGAKVMKFIYIYEIELKKEAKKRQ